MIEWCVMAVCDRVVWCDLYAVCRVVSERVVCERVARTVWWRTVWCTTVRQVNEV